ncbi:MAG TPA: M56 family metallopeptidase [Chryseosolibacter sp.]
MMTNMIPDLFNSDWANALGWTLLHSIWQSLLILLIVMACLRFIPVGLSRVRYALVCSGFFLMVLGSLITFIYLFTQSHSAGALSSAGHPQYYFSQQHGAGAFAIERLFSLLVQLIQQNMPLIVTAWIAGLILFVARLLSGVFYTYRLTSSAEPLQNEWRDYITTISARLGIRKLITLAQSRAITSPIVIGYFKPVILIPVGMLSGLTTEQLETIFLHELAHIKRHDYLVNFIQSVVETVFFFNPVVWTLSELIRREREFCCDDLVVQRHGHPGAYARALVQLEEARLSKHVFALSLAEDRNQLLNRIRRIMEKSVKSYSGKSRFLVPAVLLAVGLLSVSWLSIHQENGFQQDTSPAVQQDTVKPKNKKGSAVYTRKSIITTDKNGQPHEEVVEDFEGDESLRPLMQNGLPGFSHIMPPGFQPPFPDPHLNPATDSIPFPGFDFKDQKEWEEMSRAFEDNFGKQFEQFYSWQDVDPSTFLKEFEERFDLPAPFEEFGLGSDSLRGFNGFPNEEQFKDLKDQMDQLKDLRMEHLGQPDADFREHNFQRYEKALHDQLVRDGYLSQKETIKSMEWSDSTFKVNGKEVKEGDRKKYQELHDQYMGHGRLSGRME